MLLTLLIHEAGHYAAAKAMGEKLAELEIAPLGGIMRYQHGFIPSKGFKGILVHGAGPAANWAILLASGIPALKQAPPAFMRSLVFCNASMLMINLLPVLPLDGGQIVFCLAYYFFPVSNLVRCLSTLGKLVGILGVLLSIYGLLVHQLINCSLLIISLYLLLGAEENQRTLIAENYYTVVHERMLSSQQIRRLVCYQVPADMRLLNLLDLLKQNTVVLFVFSVDTQTAELTEQAFCRALLIMNNPTVAEAYAHTMQCK